MRNFWHTIFKPPYLNLPWLIWTYVIASSLIVRHGGVYTGHLFGFDDEVREVQILNWINGASWYDRTIMRVNAPDGFTTIWSRLVDLPIAAVIVAMQHFVSQKTAALIAAAVIPPLELAILFVAAPYFVRPLVGKNKSRLIVLFLLFTSLLCFKDFSMSGFFIGEMSHHPWYVILNLLMFGAAARMAMGSSSTAPVFMIGCAAALLTAVGIEGYPMIAGSTFIIALTSWAFNRPRISAQGAKGLMCGALGSFCLLPLHQPAQHFFEILFTQPSILGVVLVGAAGAFLGLEQFILTKVRKRFLSLACLGITALLMAAILICAFPRILDGAAAGLSPSERALALHEHHEALSIYTVSLSTLDFVDLIMPCVIALAVGLYSLSYTRNRRRAVHVCYVGFAALGAGMSFLFSRYYHHAMTTACAWLLWAWEKIKERLPSSKHHSLLVGLSFIALGPLWMLILPAAEANAPFSSHILFFPASLQSDDSPCDSLPLAHYINAHYGKDTLLLVPFGLSAQFLSQTELRIDFLANYPSQDKFIDNYDFISTRIPEIARMIVAQHKVDLVAICKSPAMYDVRFPIQYQPFLALLQAGLEPAWLKPVKTGLPPNFTLYEVDKTAIKEPGSLVIPAFSMQKLPLH